MKVLIISNNSFSKTQCNGKTLKSFFSGLDPDNIAQLYFGNNEFPDLEVCHNYYRITETQVVKSLMNLSFSTSNTHSLLMKYRTENKYKESSLMQLLKKNAGNLSLFREFIWDFHTWDTKELKNWIEEFNPNLIFTLLGNNVYVHKIALKLSKRYRLPLVAYFTDDYVINSTANTWIEKCHYKQICKQYEKTMSNTSLQYVIGEKMKQDYSIKYKRKFGVLGNCIDFSKFSHLNPIKIDKSQPITISFIGGIHSNRWKSIVQLGYIIKRINEKNGLQLVVKVFTMGTLDNVIKKAFDNAGIEFCGALNDKEVIDQIEKSHFLLHVESFDEKYRKYVKYSISTKISECLVSKRMIIAYGPHEVASISLINDNSFGCCLTDLDDENQIICKLEKAIENYNTYDFNKQYLYAVKYYDRHNIHKQLINDMASLL